MGNVSNFGPGITTYGCGYNVLDLQKKGAAAEGSKAGNIYDFKLQSVIDYHFTVQGCGLREMSSSTSGTAKISTA